VHEGAILVDCSCVTPRRIKARWPGWKSWQPTVVLDNPLTSIPSIVNAVGSRLSRQGFFRCVASPEGAASFSAN